MKGEEEEEFRNRVRAAALSRREPELSLRSSARRTYCPARDKNREEGGFEAIVGRFRILPEERRRQTSRRRRRRCLGETPAQFMCASAGLWRARAGWEQFPPLVQQIAGVRARKGQGSELTDHGSAACACMYMRGVAGSRTPQFATICRGVHPSAGSLIGCGRLSFTDAVPKINRSTFELRVLVPRPVVRVGWTLL